MVQQLTLNDNSSENAYDNRSLGLSRRSVGEALRILEVQGLVHARAGRYGGSTVPQPSTDMLGDSLSP